MRAADRNMQRLLADLELYDAWAVASGEVVSDAVYQRYVVVLDDRATDVLMPDLPLSQVRYLHGDEPPRVDLLPPRLRVDGCDWYWPFALEAVHEALLGEDDPEDGPFEITVEDVRAAVAKQREQAAQWRSIEAALRSA